MRARSWVCRMRRSRGSMPRRRRMSIGRSQAKSPTSFRQLKRTGERPLRHQPTAARETKDASHEAGANEQSGGLIMGRFSKIEWCDSTWSPWWGCTEVSEACDKCWARRETRGGAWGKNPRVRTSAKYWREPLLWNADAPRFQREHGHRQRVFGGHICDWFDNQAPEEWRADAWKLVHQTPNLVWQILTKRPQNIAKMLPPDS